jgi:hypothetical protein
LLGPNVILGHGAASINSRNSSASDLFVLSQRGAGTLEQRLSMIIDGTKLMGTQVWSNNL